MAKWLDEKFARTKQKDQDEAACRTRDEVLVSFYLMMRLRVILFFLFYFFYFCDFILSLFSHPHPLVILAAHHPSSHTPLSRHAPDLAGPLLLVLLNNLKASCVPHHPFVLVLFFLFCPTPSSSCPKYPLLFTLFFLSPFISPPCQDFSLSLPYNARIPFSSLPSFCLATQHKSRHQNSRFVPGFSLSLFHCCSQIKTLICRTSLRLCVLDCTEQRDKQGTNPTDQAPDNFFLLSFSPGTDSFV